MALRFHLRVNGIKVSHLKVRNRLQWDRGASQLVPLRQLVIRDFVITDLEENSFPLGDFAIDDSCMLEIKDMNTTNSDWKRVSLAELFNMFQATGAIT